MCHIIAGMVNYHMTHISTYNKCLKPGISPKFDRLQNIPLTQNRHHDNLSLKILLTSSPAPNTFPRLLIGCQDAEAPFSALSLVIKLYGSL